MESAIDLWVIKGIPKETLTNHLMSYKKDTLFQLAVQHQVEARKSYTKAKITELLIPVIKEHFSTEWSHFSSIEKEAFLQLQNAEEAEFRQLQKWIEKGYLFIYLDREQMEVKMPNEWTEQISQDTTVSTSNETGNFGSFYRNAATFKQIFGYINVHYLVTVWNRYYETKLEIEEAGEMLKEKNILS